MTQQTDLTFSKNAFTEALKVGLFMSLSFFGFMKTLAQADSTFFPDNTPEAATENSEEGASDAIKEWAELSPSPKSKQSPEKKEERDLVSAQPQDSKLTNEEDPQLAPVPDVATTPNAEIPSSTQEPKPLQTVADTPTQEPKPLQTVADTSTQETKPLQTVADTPASNTPPASEIEKPLQTATVAPRPQALPIEEKSPPSIASKEQNSSEKETLSYSDAAKERTPLGILEPAQETNNQRWYIYSSAIRGLKNSSGGLQIVSMEGGVPNRGQEVKNLLVEMGIEPEKIQLVNAKGEKAQEGFVYIFAD